MIWVVLSVINYYSTSYFVATLMWLVMSLGFLALTIFLVVKLIKHREGFSLKKLLTTLIIFILFIFTFYPRPVNRLIEKADWHVFYSERCKVVSLVREDKLKPNVSWNNWLCELPYEFPVVSNGGNDILINKIDSTGKVTVTFWVLRNFFDAPSIHFVYTDDPKEIEEINSLIKNNPENNWEIQDNWYRVVY